jgi:hypothetical protein
VAKPTAKKEPKPEPRKAEPDKQYEKEDFPGVKFQENVRWTETRELFSAIKKKFDIDSSDTVRVKVGDGKRGPHGVSLSTYYITFKGELDNVLGKWTVTGADKQPGRGFTTYGEGCLAIPTDVQKKDEENQYGHWIMPQHGAAYLSTSTENSYGPWDKESAQMHIGDAMAMRKYDDEFNHGGRIKVVKVKKAGGKWVTA